MRSHRLATITATLILTLMLPSTTVAADHQADESALLSGTFGKVLGADPADPATAAPGDRPLASWMRSETLELVLAPPIDDETSVSITATADDRVGSVALPFDDRRWVTGPDTPGFHTITATIVRGEAEPHEYAWLLDVGDRPGGWETMLAMPAIEGSLVATSGAVVGDRGHGCLTAFCQEVGYRPPIETLEPLAVMVEEPLTLELSDGSAIDHWEGWIEPYGAASETRFAEATFDEPVAGPVLAGLEPDAPGEWLLEVRADYDRERGWQWYLYRLIAE